MKQFVKSSLLVLCLAFLFASCQALTKRQISSEDLQAKMIGTYKGVIFSSGVDCLGKTSISKSASGILSGEYEFMEKGLKVSGTLYDFQIIAPLKLKCKWRDKYGTGDLEMSFNEDITEFSGKWNAEGESERFPWNGSK